jgi:N-acetylmuramoyl-L-alanine amidase
MIHKVFFLLNRICFIGLIVSFLLGTSLLAQSSPELRVKFSQQGQQMRVVLEGDESYISRANITTSGPLIRVGFPGPFILKTEKALPIELISQNKALTVNLKEQYEVRFFRLSDPARLVFDIQKPGASGRTHAGSIRRNVVVLDAGHGGYDFGITKGSVSEKDLTLNIAKELARALSKKGKKVSIMRKVDQFISLADRIEYVNQKSPGIFISLHVSRLQAFVLYSPRFDEQELRSPDQIYRIDAHQRRFVTRSKALAESFKKSLSEEYKTEIIHREMPIPILHSAGAPAVCIEVPSPEFSVYDEQARARLVNAVMNGIALYEP